MERQAGGRVTFAAVMVAHFPAWPAIRDDRAEALRQAGRQIDRKATQQVRFSHHVRAVVSSFVASFVVFFFRCVGACVVVSVFFKVDCIYLIVYLASSCSLSLVRGELGPWTVPPTTCRGSNELTAFFKNIQKDDKQTHKGGRGRGESPLYHSPHKLTHTHIHTYAKRAHAAAVPSRHSSLF